MSNTAIIEYASGLVGLTADPSTPWRQLYLALIAPGETPQRQAEMAVASGCALVCRGILRRFIVHPILERPYRTGDAMSDLVAIAREAGALRTVGATPQPGDMVIVGGGTDGGGPEHVWTWLGDGGVDGGQVVDRYQCITAREHHVADGWDRTDTYRRRVRWVVDTCAVVRALGR